MMMMMKKKKKTSVGKPVTPAPVPRVFSSDSSAGPAVKPFVFCSYLFIFFLGSFVFLFYSGRHRNVSLTLVSVVFLDAESESISLIFGQYRYQYHERDREQMTTHPQRNRSHWKTLSSSKMACFFCLGLDSTLGASRRKRGKAYWRAIEEQFHLKDTHTHTHTHQTEKLTVTHRR